MNLTRGINLQKIADEMPGASGAEIKVWSFPVFTPGAQLKSSHHKAVCTEAGMYALRERRVHVTQEDFEMAVSKVMKKDSEKNMSLNKLWK
jgi:26S proteasome regulatory subunit T6